MKKEPIFLRIIHYCYNLITSDEANTFEKRMFLISTFFTSLFAIPMMLVNLDPSWPLMHTIAIINFGVINFIFFAIARWGKKYLVFGFIVFSVINTFFIWLFNQGVEGSLNFYFLACFMYSIILMRGKKRAISLIISTVLVTAFFAFDYFCPDLIDSLYQYPNRADKVLDLYAGMISIFAIMLITINSIVKNYDIERNISTQKIEELHLNSITDRLTTLFNRGYLNDKLLEYATNTKTTNFYFSIFMVDIDHFKSVNDTYGHTAGDEILKTVAQIIKYTVRKADTAGRYGGEEFMVVLPLTHLEDAMLTAEKIRSEIEKTRYIIVPDLIKTASFGCAEYTNGEQITAFINRADTSLYEAKHTGRNKVIGHAADYSPAYEGDNEHK